MSTVSRGTSHSVFCYTSHTNWEICKKILNLPRFQATSFPGFLIFEPLSRSRGGKTRDPGNKVGFQGARPDHAWDKSSSCCFLREIVRYACPRELVKFDPWHVTRPPPIKKRIWDSKYINHNSHKQAHFPSQVNSQLNANLSKLTSYLDSYARNACCICLNRPPTPN